METIPVTHLNARVKQLRAQFMPDRSTDKMHVFWIGYAKRWVKVVRKGAVVNLTYHAECPCSGG